MNRTKLRTLCVALAATMVLAACGTTEDSTDDETDTAGAGESITLTDAAGRTFELPGPATKVVTTEWQQTEDVLALGVDPVGVADTDGYSTWDTSVELPQDVTDVGDRTEPNIEAITSLNPDLVIVEGSRPDAVVKQLLDRDIPVLLTSGASTDDAIGQMRKTLTLIAKALGKDAEAEELMADFNQALSDGRQAIADANVSPKTFAYADAYLNGSNVSIRMFGPGSYVSDIATELGLRNAWKGKVDPAYGLGTTDVEGLTNLGNVNFFYTDTESSEWLDALSGNAVWNNLPFVKGDQLYPFPTGIWTFGGPKSGEQIIDAFVKELTK